MRFLANGVSSMPYQRFRSKDISSMLRSLNSIYHILRQTSRNYSIQTLKETGPQKKVVRKNIDRYKNKIAFLIHGESGLLSGVL